MKTLVARCAEIAVDESIGVVCGSGTFQGHPHIGRIGYAYAIGSLRDTQALPSPPPGRAPSAPVPRVDKYGIGADPSKRSAPGFAVSGDGG
eukprot:870483-Prymnesium_polylepis.3